VRGAALFFHHAQEGTPAVKAGLKAGDVIHGRERGAGGERARAHP